MSEFLDLAVWIWDLLVMQLLPLFSMLLAVIFIYKISQAANITVSKFGKKLANTFKTRGR